MVYHISSRYVLKKLIEPLIMALFSFLVIRTAPVVFEFFGNNVVIENTSVYVFFPFLVTSFLSSLRLHHCLNTVLVVDSNGLIYRKKDKITKFAWGELTAIEVFESGARVKMIKLLPYEKSLNVSFLKGVGNLKQDIEKHSSGSIPEKYLLSNRC